MKDKDVQLYQEHHKKSAMSAKFVFKKRSITVAQRSVSISDGRKNENVGGNKIFNYRGIGLSRSKLTTLLKQFIFLVKERLQVP